MLPQLPRISVITPTYNRSIRIMRTIESVLGQTFEDFEYLVVDDGSTDDTADVVRAAARKDPRVVYVHQENGGGASARSCGLALARGEYIAFLDHDDCWVGDKLEQQVDYLDRHPEDGCVYGKVTLIDETGADRGEQRLRRWGGQIQQKLLVHQNFMSTYSNPMFRVRVLRSAGGPDPSVGMADDWDLFIRVAGQAQVGFIDRVLVLYNVGNASSQSRNMLLAIQSEAEVLRKHAALVAQLGLAGRCTLAWNLRRRRAQMLRTAGYLAQVSGDLRTALGWYCRAAGVEPTVLMSTSVLKDLGALALRLAWGRG
jgi:glycosyltransferase involved in cell wall biosynthesis